MAPEMDRETAPVDVSFTGLCAGRLQVPDGTLVIVDETVLETGKLEERGAFSLYFTALRNVSNTCQELSI
jgi:hypothetical protein